MAKPKASDIKCILYTICIQWTGGNVMMFLLLSRIRGNHRDEHFWCFQIILDFKDGSALLQHSYLWTRPYTDPLHICHSADTSCWSILPYITQKLTICTVNGNNPHSQSLLWSGWHSPHKQQNNTTEHRKWEAFIGFCNMETVKITSMMRDTLPKIWQLHRWSRNFLCLWILNVHYHIHEPLSLTFKNRASYT